MFYVLPDGCRYFNVSKPLSGRSLLQAGLGEALLVVVLSLQTAKRSFTFARYYLSFIQHLWYPVSKPLSGRSLLQGLPLKRRVFDGFGRLFFALSANLPFTLDSPRII